MEAMDSDDEAIAGRAVALLDGIAAAAERQATTFAARPALLAAEGACDVLESHKDGGCAFQAIALAQPGTDGPEP